MSRPTDLNRFAWPVTILLGVCCLANWFLPVSKPEAAFGRLTYPQFVVAIAGTVAFAGALWIMTARLQHRKRRAFVVAALCISGGGALLCAEVVAAFLPTKKNPFYFLNQGDMIAHQKLDRRIPFIRPPNLHWEGWVGGNISRWQSDTQQQRWVEFQTDEDGFRNPTPATQADLVFIGDSFTEGVNVSGDETFVQLTAKRLKTTARNLGVCSWMPQAELAALEQYGLRLNPKAVVWQLFEGNDLSEAHKYAGWEAQNFPRIAPDQGDTRWQQSSITYTLFRVFVQHEDTWSVGMFREADGTSRAFRFFERPAFLQALLAVETADVTQHPGWRPTVAALRRGKEILRQRGIPLIVVYIPTKLTVMHDLVEADQTILDFPDDEAASMGVQLGRVCQELDVVYVDPTVALRELAARGEAGYFPNDSHFSPRGHEAVSELIAQALSDLQP